MGDGMKAYMGKCVKTGKYMVHVEHQGIKPYTELYDTQKEADEAIQADFQAEREGGIFK